MEAALHPAGVAELNSLCSKPEHGSYSLSVCTLPLLPFFLQLLNTTLLLIAAFSGTVALGGMVQGH